MHFGERIGLMVLKVRARKSDVAAYSRRIVRLCSAMIGCCVLLAASTNAAADEAREIAFFESKIRPILAARCYECHAQSAKQVQGGLLLDTGAGIRRGGESGPVLVPGKPSVSSLIQAVSYDGDVQMPPIGKLPAEEIGLLTEWVRRGAPTPADNGAIAAKEQIDFEAGRQFWSFQPPRRSALPPVRQAGWPKRPIDHFVLATLESKKLSPSPPADRRTLIRRTKFDLVGLPPTIEEVERLVADDAPDWYEQYVDDLLASPQYGERWGRYWLDLARYADGNTVNLELRGQAWLYRDWVVRALNEDLAYDAFVRRQLAVDQMPEHSPADLAALGFLGISPEYWKELKLAPAVIEQIVADEWEERIDAIGRTFLGLSIACARCHDHKFDPISTEDYYALAGVLASTRLTDRFVIPKPQADIVLAAAENVKAMLEAIKRFAAANSKSPEDKAAIAELEAKIKAIENLTPAYHSAKAHAVDDAALYVLPSGPNQTRLEYKPGLAIDLCVHIRGNPAKPGALVPRRFLTVLSTGRPRIFEHGSGRLELADALVRDGAPLSARVIVNRVWKMHFGRGLVETTSDFGRQGARPSHPELLDDLTCRFVEHGWSLKWLHRELLLSATYQQTGSHDVDKLSIDPDNRWLWRMGRRRLDIEAWRDSLLATCANLDQRLGGPSIPLTANENRRRTLYGKIDRADLDDMLRLFDFPDPSTHSPEREPTTTALQQLFVLNSPFMLRQADALSERLLAGGAADNTTIVRQAFRLLLARDPSANEIQLGTAFLGTPQEGLQERVRQYSQALMGSNEFLFVD